jgi:dihydrolipoamide dehydrogenase
VSTQSHEAYDLVVIGGGPGGYVAAIRAAQAGLRTALVERDALGGICLNRGCIPSKALLQSADVLESIRHAADFGISVDGVHAKYGAALARCQRVVAAQVSGLSYLMRKYQIDVVQGTGRFLARDRIAVTGGSGGDRQLRTRASIIATGSRVRPLPGVAIDGAHILSAREVWREATLPRSILIVGAGAIGVEFATVYRAYGCDVTLVEYLPRIIPLVDEGVSAQLTESLARRGIRMMTGTRVDRAEIIDGTITVHLSAVSDPARMEEAAPPQTVRVDRVLVGAGFLPNSEGLGLEELGVATERGYIVVDEAMETTVPGIYAIGDVTGKLPLAHVASAQAEVALEAILGQKPAPLDYAAMPRCIYGSPQVASMGQTEAQARASGQDIRVGTFPFRPNGKAMALGETEGWAKIVSDAQTGEILGAHLIGPAVTELIAEMVVARSLESTPDELARAAHPHPTLSEVIAEAARNVEGQAIHG